MAYNLRWRKAVMISCICHLFFFIGAGYLSAHMLTTPVIEEKYVELELMTERQAEDIKDTIPSTASASLPHSSQSTPLPTENRQISASADVSNATTSAVTTEALRVTSISGGDTGNASSEPSAVSNSNANYTGTKSSGNNIIRPSILNKVNPVYPQSARSAGIEGTVVVKIQIFENGRSGSISISRSSQNEQLDNAAIAAVRQWQFVPAKDRDSGQAVACYTTIPISFRLTSNS